MNSGELALRRFVRTVLSEEIVVNGVPDYTRIAKTQNLLRHLGAHYPTSREVLLHDLKTAFMIMFGDYSSVQSAASSAASSGDSTAVEKVVRQIFNNEFNSSLMEAMGQASAASESTIIEIFDLKPFEIDLLISDISSDILGGAVYP